MEHNPFPHAFLTANLTQTGGDPMRIISDFVSGMTTTHKSNKHTELSYRNALKRLFDTLATITISQGAACLAAVLWINLAAPAFSENFSCRIGTSAACLDYGDTICSSNGMCVGKDAACFDSYQCNYEGFTCKSNVTKSVQANDKLLGEYNELVEKYNKLSRASKAMDIALEDVKNCLIIAANLDDARLCSP